MYSANGHYNPIAGVFYINWEGNQIRFLNANSGEFSIPHENFKYMMRLINQYYGSSTEE